MSSVTAASNIFAQRPTLWQHVQFVIRIVRSDLANFFLYQYRGADGLLITGKNSGTHWLKFMLSCALAKQYNIPRPRHSSGTHANDIFGDLLRPRSHPRMPRIGSSHTVPSVIFSWNWLTRVLPHPPVVVLVRDIKAAMASHYLKWQGRLEEPLCRYVRGDPSGQRYKADVWWYIRFFNRWGDAARANPAKVLVVRYEDLEAEPAAWLRRIATHLRLDLHDDAFAEALRGVDRNVIRSLADPGDTETVVPPDGASASVAYSRTDLEFIHNTIARYLRHDFGYEYIRNGRWLSASTTEAIQQSMLTDKAMRLLPLWGLARALLLCGWLALNLLVDWGFSKEAGLATVGAVDIGTAVLGSIILGMTVRGLEHIRRNGVALSELEGRRTECDSAVCIAAALLLILPGVGSDVAGVLLLLTPIRQFLSTRLASATLRWRTLEDSYASD